jgi:hypothetical protein
VLKNAQRSIEDAVSLNLGSTARLYAASNLEVADLALNASESGDAACQTAKELEVVRQRALLGSAIGQHGQPVLRSDILCPPQSCSLYLHRHGILLVDMGTKSSGLV